MRRVFIRKQYDLSSLFRSGMIPERERNIRVQETGIANGSGLYDVAECGIHCWND